AMSYRVLLLAALAGAACACNGAPGRPAPDSAVIAPDKVVDFDVLYPTNCAGCHGANGTGGAAIGLADPVYLAIADDATIRRVTADGAPGTAMPAFAQTAGGLLTAAQIDVIVNGIRARWAKPTALADANVPPYAAPAPGDPARGAAVYARYCSSCHGADGRSSRGSGSASTRSSPRCWAYRSCATSSRPSRASAGRDTSRGSRSALSTSSRRARRVSPPIGTPW